MAFFTSMLKQKITVWNSNGVDQFGSPSWASPVTINGRKESRTELFRGDDNVEHVARGVFYLDAADVTVKARDRIFLGTSTAADPTDVASEEVEDILSVPSLDATSNLLKVLVQ